MGSKRAQKAKKRAQREARRQTRRAQRQATPERQSQRVAENPLIGYLAHNGAMVLCDGDACVIAGSRRRLQEIIQRFGTRFADMRTIQPAPFFDILDGMRRGSTYCFDEEAYGRFLEPGRRIGLALTDEDFSDPGPLGMHFVPVQCRVLPRRSSGASA